MNWSPHLPPLLRLYTVQDAWPTSVLVYCKLPPSPCAHACRFCLMRCAVRCGSDHRFVLWRHPSLTYPTTAVMTTTTTLAVATTALSIRNDKVAIIANFTVAATADPTVATSTLLTAPHLPFIPPPSSHLVMLWQGRNGSELVTKTRSTWLPSSCCLYRLKTSHHRSPPSQRWTPPTGGPCLLLYSTGYCFPHHL